MREFALITRLASEAIGEVLPASHLRPRFRIVVLSAFVEDELRLASIPGPRSGCWSRHFLGVVEVALCTIGTTALRAQERTGTPLCLWR